MMYSRRKKILSIICFTLISVVIIFLTLNSKNTNDANLKKISNEEMKIISTYYDNIMEKYNSIQLIAGKSYKRDEKAIENYLYLEISNEDYNKLTNNLESFSIITKKKSKNESLLIIRKINNLNDELGKKVENIYMNNKKITILPYKYINF